MQLDSPHYTRCLKILSRSPLFASLDDALLKDMLKMLHYETWIKDETAISPRQAEPNAGETCSLLYPLLYKCRETIRYFFFPQ